MKKVINLLVVDESGSMEVIRPQALAGINETLGTIQALQKEHEDLEQRVTLITFDSTHKKLFYYNVKACDAHPLTPDQYSPCGGTPLYDTIGMGIAKVNAQAQEGDNVLVTIITDDYENCSTEYNLPMIKTLIEKLKKQNWTFCFIGTDNLDVKGFSESMGIDNHLQFREDEKGTRDMFRAERKCRKNFYNSIVLDECCSSSTNYFAHSDSDEAE